MATQRSQSHTAAIVSNPKICGGSPTIAGTRIRVSDIVLCQRIEGEDVAGILEAYPHLTREQVECALGYYEQHRAAIDRYIEEEKILATKARWQQQHST